MITAPRMGIPTLLAACMVMVTGIKSRLVSPRRQTAARPGRQLWQPVSAITERSELSSCRSSLIPAVLKKKYTGQFLYNFGLKQCLIFILARCLPYYMQISKQQYPDSTLEKGNIPVFFFSVLCRRNTHFEDLLHE